MRAVSGGRAFPIGTMSDSDELDVRLRAVQRMGTIGKLAVGVSHDVANMLTPIMSYSQLIANALPAACKLQSYLSEIQKAAESVADLTSQLMLLASTRSFEPGLISLNDVIVDLDRVFRRIIGGDIQLASCLSPGNETVRADRNHIQQVLINLVYNARDAMPHGGTLTIQTAKVAADHETDGGHPVHAVEEHVVMVVGDTGTGMTSETKQRIFEPFFTTKEPSMGTGLGLATCRSIVSEAGGHITVESEPGQGSWFSICFPRAEA